MNQLPHVTRAARLCGVIVSVFLLTLTCSAVARAQAGRSATRTWVSAATGSSTNPCTRDAPCRELSAAVAAVAEGGEVLILDSGSYDAVEITKSVQIVAPEGVHAVINPTVGIAVPGDPSSMTTSVLVNAPAATVILRNLTVVRQGTIDNGIRTTAVGVLHVESCVVDATNNTSSSQGGIHFTASGRLIVRDTTARHNGMGVLVSSPSEGTNAYASIDRCRLDDNLYGIVASSRSRVSVSNTVAAGADGGVGFYVAPNQVAAPAELSCDNCAASKFTFGFAVAGGPGALIRVARSVAVHNFIGFSNNSSNPGKFKSLAGTNMVDGNLTNRSGQITTFSPDAP